MNCLKAWPKQPKKPSSMRVCMAETMTGYQGHTVHALPLDQLQDVMKKYRH